MSVRISDTVHTAQCLKYDMHTHTCKKIGIVQYLLLLPPCLKMQARTYGGAQGATEDECNATADIESNVNFQNRRRITVCVGGAKA